MATAKRTTAAKTKPAEEVAPVSDEAGGVAPNLLQFVDPDKAAELAAEAAAQADDKAEVAPETEDPDDAKADSEAEVEAPAGDQKADTPVSDQAQSEDEGDALPAGRDYIVLATAIGGEDNQLFQTGDVITLDDAKAEWLVSRGAVKPA